ncbi:hypothetical protein BpHYR1_024026 [Brachionus plicatilis]|uniref:Uncharacterized protein n=1 Tax=Brachionus plicatilis TaxID=10195 RepID=A0A3M7SIP0_BRAPC|nr:hypothetical protein BpHYR1_024026 [Brachionus plicatilis]
MNLLLNNERHQTKTIYLRAKAYFSQNWIICGNLCSNVPFDYLFSKGRLLFRRKIKNLLSFSKWKNEALKRGIILDSKNNSSKINHFIDLLLSDQKLINEIENFFPINDALNYNQARLVSNEKNGKSAN